MGVHVDGWGKPGTEDAQLVDLTMFPCEPTATATLGEQAIPNRVCLSPLTALSVEWIPPSLEAKTKDLNPNCEKLSLWVLAETRTLVGDAAHIDVW
jgi:hypothetical protein